MLAVVSYRWLVCSKIPFQTFERGVIELLVSAGIVGTLVFIILITRASLEFYLNTKLMPEF
jgi:O-antigen ligase